MKVYFGASMRGKAEFGENYKLIVEAVEKLGHKLVVNTVDLSTYVEVAKETAEEAEDWYKRMIGWIDESDVAVYEVSYPSLGIGHEVAVCLHRGKPVIALHVPENPPFVLKSILNEKIQVVEYNAGNVEKVMAQAFEYAQDWLESRFTLILDGETRRMLDAKAQEGMARSEYIRKLIKEDANRSD